MSKIIAVTNQKGGVGKTTTAVNLAAALSAANRHTLLIDFDPQGNATMGSGVDKHQLEHSLIDVIKEEVDMQSILLPTKAGYDIAPSNRDLASAEMYLPQVNRREQKLLQALVKIRGRYDYIIIDCPPSLGMLTINALVAAHSVLIPVQCEYYALEGLSALLETVTTIQQSVNQKLIIEGILRTMYDARNRLTNEVSEQLTKHFADKLFTTTVPRNVRLAEAPSFGLPGILYDRQSSGAVAYQQLAEEMLQRRQFEFTQKENMHGEETSAGS
ncbi:MAG: ParA family protein [Pseudomonadota bacterium]